MRDQGVALEVHLGDQPLGEARAEDREVDVRRAPVVDPVPPGVGAGLHGAEVVVAVLVGQRPAAAAEVRVDRREVGVLLVAVAAAGVGLPELDQGVRHRPPALVEDAAVHDDPLADRLAAVRVVADEVVVERAEVGMAERRPGDLAQRVLQRQQRVARRAGDAGLVGGRQGRRVQRPVALEELGGSGRCSIRRLSPVMAPPPSPRRSA